MDRRGFLTTAGTLGAAAAGGVIALEPSAAEIRAAGLARAAGASPAAGEKAANAIARAQPGLSLGFLPGSQGLLEAASQGRAWDRHWVSQMRWAAWHRSFSLPIYEKRADVAIGTLHAAEVWTSPNLTQVIEVVAHFAFDVSPYFGPFNAWRYDGATAKATARRTSPLVFEAGMPDRVGLQVNYAFDREKLAPGVADRGMVYLPLGAQDGPGAGIYVMASPSRVTGALPDFTEYTFTGDLNRPMLRNTGGTPDFDFVTLTIAPVSDWT